MSGVTNATRPAYRVPMVVAALAILAPLLAPDGPRDLFLVEGRRPDRIVITRTAAIEPSHVIDTSMTNALFGVVAEIDRQSVSRVIGAIEPDAADPPVQPSERIGVMHLFSNRTATRTRLDLVRDAEGRYLASADETVFAQLRARVFEPLIADRPRFFGPFGGDGTAIPSGQVVQLPLPYLASELTMNELTMQRRLYRGMRVALIHADRALADEQMHIRLPRDYGSTEPAGLLIWASPTPDGRPPIVFQQPLDELNLICVGVDNTGNARDVPDKFQLMCDAVATVSSRFHVDSRRVYIAGMSGGGKVSSILTICFPEVFAGAVAIVGLGTHSRLDARTFGDHGWPYFSTPRGELLELAQSRRLAPMTGPNDFNYEEMRARTAALEADDFDVRLFEYADMGHVMPTPERIREALRWIDAPYRHLRQQEIGAAQMLLAAYFEDRADPIPRTQADREALIEVIRAGPWSESAWRALEMLGLLP